jgi:hypothetical protein
VFPSETGGLRRKIVPLAMMAGLAGLLTSAAAQPAVATGPGAKHRALSDETIAARQHYLGLDNVDPDTGAVRKDRVIISWQGNTSWVAALRGHVVLLDGWIPRGGSRSTVAYVGSTPEELAALRPEAFFFGHGHADHAGDLPRIIRANPDMTVYGSQNHCDDIKAEVTDVSFTCVAVTPRLQLNAAGNPPAEAFGMVNNLPGNTLPGVGVSAILHPHSMAPPDPVADPPFTKVGPCTAPPADPNDPPSWGAPTSGRVAVEWQFRVGKFALSWADTTGYDAGTKVPQAWASLPPTDVFLASIAVAGRSVMNQQLAQVRPKVYIVGHLDPCQYLVRQQVVDQLATVPATIRPMLWFISDPGDYARPMSFDPAAKAWK